MIQLTSINICKSHIFVCSSWSRKTHDFNAPKKIVNWHEAFEDTSEHNNGQKNRTKRKQNRKQLKYFVCVLLHGFNYSWLQLSHYIACKTSTINMKRKSEQWWSTISPIFTIRTITSHLNSLNMKKPRHMKLEIQVLAWDRHKECDRVKPIKHSPS